MIDVRVLIHGLCCADILKAQGILPQSPSPPPLNDSPGPSVKVEGGRNKGKGVKRKREDSENDDVVEVFSDEDNIESLQVLHTTSHAFRIPDKI